tara:strand:- start:3060 stop:3566 length:507 start_codon:yes stop_codon:yes gene_type:complete
MKKLLIMLMVGSLFGQYSAKDFEDMSQTEKLMLYDSYKKSPLLVFPLLIPSLGHAYANNWERGLKFFLAELVPISFSYMHMNNCCNTTKYNPNHSELCECGEFGHYALGIVLIPSIIYLWEKVDAYKEVKKYNRRVHKEIFGKEPPLFSLNLQPTYLGANLNLSYSFK